MPSGGVPSPRRSASPFARLGRALYARPRAVALAFCVAALGAAAYGAAVADRLQAGGLEVPGSESDRATGSECQVHDRRSGAARGRIATSRE